MYIYIYIYIYIYLCTNRSSAARSEPTLPCRASKESQATCNACACSDEWIAVTERRYTLRHRSNGAKFAEAAFPAKLLWVPATLARVSMRSSIAANSSQTEESVPKRATADSMSARACNSKQHTHQQLSQKQRNKALTLAHAQTIHSTSN